MSTLPAVVEASASPLEGGGTYDDCCVDSRNISSSHFTINMMMPSNKDQPNKSPQNAVAVPVTVTANPVTMLPAASVVACLRSDSRPAPPLDVPVKTVTLSGVGAAPVAVAAESVPSVVLKSVPIDIASLISQGRSSSARDLALEFVQAYLQHSAEWKLYLQQAPQPIYLSELIGVDHVRQVLAEHIDNQDFLCEFNKHLSSLSGVFVTNLNGRFEMQKVDQVLTFRPQD